MQRTSLLFAAGLLFAAASTAQDIPVGPGGSIQAAIAAGLGNANAAFLTIGTLSGTSPGVNVLGSPIPINVDFYTDLVLSNPNSALLANSVGVLDAAGRAESVFTLPPIPGGLPVPITAHHATLVLGAPGTLALVSNAEASALLPN